MLCIFRSRTFVPIGWSCKKQTAVSHSRTEADTISLDAGRRLEGVLALTLWDLVIQVLDFQVGKTHLAILGTFTFAKLDFPGMRCVP